MIYHGLDTYAAALLHREIMERVNPVFVPHQPHAAALATGTPVRLYTRSNTRCIAEGIVADYYTAQAFGGTGLAFGTPLFNDRVVVRLTEARVPGALAPKP